MQGDQKVDELMRPVHAAIKRHVKDSDAVTEIYNRAYEAVMNSMDVKAGKTYCAYCGAEYPLDDDAATLVSKHILMCEKHPMRTVEAELRKWQTGEIVGIEFVPKMFNELELKNARANARAEAAEAALAEVQNAECHWHIEEDEWNEWIGECGANWHFEDDGPIENECHYCMKCGKKLVVDAMKGGEE